MKQGIVHRMVPATERLSVSHLSELAFEAPLHYHTEYELIHVISGSGVEFVGGGSAPYAPGTLTLIGGGVPHLHLCAASDRASALCEVLYFPQRLFPVHLSELSELRWIDALLERSRSGVRFTGRKGSDGFVFFSSCSISWDAAAITIASMPAQDPAPVSAVRMNLCGGCTAFCSATSAGS